MGTPWPRGSSRRSRAGWSTDYYTAGHLTLTREIDLDGRSVPTTIAGRLLVSKTLSAIDIQCAGGAPWQAWLELDTVRVPGTVLDLVPSGTTLRAVTLTGVTASTVAPGGHTVSLAVACRDRDFANATLTAPQDATVVVLGG